MVRRGQGPRGFHWLRVGALAGMPAPGVTNDIEYDLDLIRQAGISCLVTLTQEQLPAEALQAAGLQSRYFPIEDMEAPSVVASAELCSFVAGLLVEGKAVGFHCKAGLGRTGTMLAAQLIWEGANAQTAVAQARSVEPSWIQSDSQVAFLSRYEEWLRRERPLVAITSRRTGDSQSPPGPMYRSGIPSKQGEH
jgi:atypical dual specificity phosphatase